MKIINNFKILAAVVFFGSNTLAANSGHVIGRVQVEAGRKSVLADFESLSNAEVFCKDIQYKFEVVGDEFGEPLGEFTQSIGKVYLQPKESRVLEGLGQEVSRFSNGDRVAIISNVKADYTQCSEVTFLEYCKHAEKTIEETHTLGRVLSASKTGRCDDVELNIKNELKGRLKLKEQGISNLKPLSYLKNVKELDLSINNISDLQKLSNMEQLVKLNVSKNPLTEIDEVVTIPNIEYIDASETGLLYKKWERVSPRLKKLKIAKTPYEKVFKDLKK